MLAYEILCVCVQAERTTTDSLDADIGCAMSLIIGILLASSNSQSQMY